MKTIEELEDGMWATIRAKVVQIWDNEHASIRQVGIVGDETGIVKFVSWEKSNLPLMEQGVEYEISNVVVSSYEEQIQISVNSTSAIERVGGVQTEIPTV